MVRLNADHHSERGGLEKGKELKRGMTIPRRGTNRKKYHRVYGEKHTPDVRGRKLQILLGTLKEGKID